MSNYITLYIGTNGVLYDASSLHNVSFADQLGFMGIGENILAEEVREFRRRGDYAGELVVPLGGRPINQIFLIGYTNMDNHNVHLVSQLCDISRAAAYFDDIFHTVNRCKYAVIIGNLNPVNPALQEHYMDIEWSDEVPIVTIDPNIVRNINTHVYKFVCIISAQGALLGFRYLA